MARQEAHIGYQSRQSTQEQQQVQGYQVVEREIISIRKGTEMVIKREVYLPAHLPSNIQLPKEFNRGPNKMNTTAKSASNR